MGMLTLARFFPYLPGLQNSQQVKASNERPVLYSLAERKASESSFLNVIHYLVKLDLSHLTLSLTFDLVISMYMVLLHVNSCHITIKVNFYMQLACCRNLIYEDLLYILYTTNYT